MYNMRTMCGIISLGWNDRGNPSFLASRYFEIRHVVLDEILINVFLACFLYFSKSR